MAEICRDINELDKDTREGLKVFLEECTKVGLNMKVTETYRTVERQKELYAQGRTTSGKVVTNCDGVRNISIHQTRRAFDVCQNIKGKEYEDAVMKKAGIIGTELGFIWGGSWGWDSPHFELSKGKKIVAKDDDLQRAVAKIAIKIPINVTSWNSLDKINLKNVPALLTKLGGLDKLVKDGIISNHSIWVNGSYNAQNVRSLLIKYASKIA